MRRLDSMLNYNILLFFSGIKIVILIMFGFEKTPGCINFELSNVTKTPKEI